MFNALISLILAVSAIDSYGDTIEQLKPKQYEPVKPSPTVSIAPPAVVTVAGLVDYLVANDVACESKLKGKLKISVVVNVRDMDTGRKFYVCLEEKKQSGN